MNQLITVINNSGKSNKEMLEEVRMLKEAVYVLLDAARVQQYTNKVVVGMAKSSCDSSLDITSAEEEISYFIKTNR